MNLQNWFMGVVEDASDPKGMGRVKVRCFGYHTPDRNILPTSDLPFATVILPPTSASVGGAGETSGIIEGSMVFGCFYDGSELQDAVILGVFPGGTMTEINYDPIRNVGFGSIGRTGRGFPFAADAFGNSGRSQSGINAASSGPYYSQHGFYDYPPPTFVPGGSQDRLISIAKSQLGVKETSGNVGLGIAKYWESVTDGSGKYGDFWCAAFTSWVIEQSGILPREKLPGTSAVRFYRSWASKNPDVTVGRKRPKEIYAGDIILFNTHSHIGIAVENSNGSTVKSIEGNTAGGGPSTREVAIVTRNLSSIGDAITIKSTGRQPIGGGPESTAVYVSRLSTVTSVSAAEYVSRLLDQAEAAGGVRVDPYADNTPYANGAAVELPERGSVGGYYGPNPTYSTPAPENKLFPESGSE